jgi:ribosome-associated translation inhibitor RaiA
MRIQFHIRGLKENAGLRHRLQQSLERLETHFPISAAAVVLEHERNNAPAFRAYALLAVPGPDIHVEARDHTLEAVWLKVTTALREQIDQRKSRQDSRVKNNGHVRSRTMRRTSSADGRFGN